MGTWFRPFPPVNGRVADAMTATWSPQGGQTEEESQGPTRGPLTPQLNPTRPLHFPDTSADRHTLSLRASEAMSQFPAASTTWRLAVTIPNRDVTAVLPQVGVFPPERHRSAFEMPLSVSCEYRSVPRAPGVLRSAAALPCGLSVLRASRLW